jgi:hypothetical protein
MSRPDPPSTGSSQDLLWKQSVAAKTSRAETTTPFGGGLQFNAEAVTQAEARGIRQSSDIDEITYASSINDDIDTKPRGQITTLLDLTNRDIQENDLFPLKSEITWFARSTERRLAPFSSLIQEIPYRGPAAFGQRFSFDLGSLLVGDLLFGAALQIRLGHWLDAYTQNMIAGGKFTFTDPQTAWEYANGLGSSIIEMAELEIDGQTIEMLDGDFINTFSLLFPDSNSQFGIAQDHLGRVSIPRLMAKQQPGLFPTEDGILHCILPFFFMRTRVQDALPMVSMREGIVRIHVTLRPFHECVRQLRGFRDSCTDTPLEKTFAITSTVAPTSQTTRTGAATPSMESVQLITYGAIVDGALRQRMLRAPYEIIHRELQTFYFDEPLKYTVSKRADNDTIRIQLPLEANHPLEEIIWFVRRKGVRENNAWTNYTSVLERDWVGGNGPRRAAARPLLLSAAIQANGVTICEAEEQYYRQLIAQAHRGGIIPYNSYIYGYPFARNPGEHQPSGTMNASRLNSLRLTLEVQPPGGVGDGDWEVKVFCIGLNWLRFENGIANPMFED